MTRNKAPPEQTSLFDAFAAAELEQQTAHLPSTINEAIPCYRHLLERHHAAFMSGDPDLAARIATECEQLAHRVNGGRFGYLADEDSSGRVLERETAAPDGAIPLWGQCGLFVLSLPQVRVRVELAGLFGIGFPSMAAYVVDRDKPFISETGYRSFLGVGDMWRPGMTTEAFARAVVERHVAGALKGRLVALAPQYVRPEPD